MVAKLPGRTCGPRPQGLVGGMDSPDVARPLFDD
jgi:hypothetical protein